MSAPINETLIRDVVAEVLSRLGATTSAPTPRADSSKPDCNCHHKRNGSSGKHFGVFADAGEACEAAAEAFVQLQQKGVEGRRN